MGAYIIGGENIISFISSQNMLNDDTLNPIASASDNDFFFIKKYLLLRLAPQTGQLFIKRSGKSS
jgi:hypothetical protein